MNFESLPPVVPCVSAQEMSLMDPSRMNFGKLKSMCAPVEEQPKRPLSAYNIFFQVERQRLISATPETGSYSRAEVYSICLDKATRIEKAKRPHRKMHGMISFTDLAKRIAQKWRELNKPEKKLFEERADDEKRKYAIELEEWLLKQNPTQQVKKRLSALRRGSLSKFIPGREESVPSSTSSLSTPPAAFAKPPVHTISQTPSSSTLRPVAMKGSVGDEMPGNRCPQPQTLSRREIQLQRARNLERLYQMQIQLYNEQCRLHAECNGEFDFSYDFQQQIHSPQEAPKVPPMSTASAQPRVVSSDSLHWGRSHGYEYSNPIDGRLHSNPRYDNAGTSPSTYVRSPFHATDGRNSPFGGDNDDLFTVN
eukprot:scaffold42958_cov206-Amphora_coffeaeformis.AAC.1